MLDYTNIITAIVAAISGGGIWGVIQTKVSKRKSPYDMMCEMLQEQKKFYAEKNGELEKEKQDSREKSYIIAQTRLCKAKVKDPSIICPVEDANDDRLKTKCQKCDHKDDCDEN